MWADSDGRRAGSETVSALPEVTGGQELRGLPPACLSSTSNRPGLLSDAVGQSHARLDEPAPRAASPTRACVICDVNAAELHLGVALGQSVALEALAWVRPAWRPDLHGVAPGSP